MAEWMIDDPAAYENKKDFHIALYEAPAFGVSHVLARKRTAHLKQLLTTFGVPASMISMEIAPYNQGKSMAPNFAHINFMPGCPHPCCPGPEPTSQIR